jgi:hypothetical protein
MCALLFSHHGVDGVVIDQISASADIVEHSGARLPLFLFRQS